VTPLTREIELDIPFPGRISGWVGKAEDELLDWARRKHLARSEAAQRHLAAARFGHLAARVYPDAGPEALALAAQWIGWFFRTDDQFDDGPLGRRPDHVEDLADELTTIVTASGTRPVPRSPVADALGDLWSRTAPQRSRRWQRRFAKHLDRWLETVRQQAANRACQSRPEEEAHASQRRLGMVQNCIDLIEFTGEFEVPTALEATAEFRRLRDLTADVVDWTNDLFSLDKELVRHDMHNAVILAQHHRGVSLGQAAAAVAVRVRDSVQDFTAGAARLGDTLGAAGLTANERDSVQRAIEGMKLMMRGHLDWAVGNPRYSAIGAGFAADVPEHLDVILHVPHLADQPRPRFAHLEQAVA
jgi:hypothetical protein